MSVKRKVSTPRLTLDQRHKISSELPNISPRYREQYKEHLNTMKHNISKKRHQIQKYQIQMAKKRWRRMHKRLSVDVNSPRHNKSIISWSNKDVLRWLNQLSININKEKFQEEQITGKSLVGIQEKHLLKLGFKKIGPMLEFIWELNQIR